MTMAAKVALLVLAGTTQGVSALFPKNESSKFQIEVPTALHKTNPDVGGYLHRLSDFGHWPRPESGSMTHQVFYVEDSLCQFPLQNWTADAVYPQPHRHHDAGDGNGNETKPPTQIDAPYFLMTQRGDCSYVTKTRHAQMMGAAALIIADTVCMCGDEDCINQTNPDHCETYQPHLSDDGSGNDVSIPAVLLRLHDAIPIVEELKTKDLPVMATLSWQRPQLDAWVEYAMWSGGPLDRHTLAILKDFEEVANALDPKIRFQYHYVIQDGIRLGCTFQGDDEAESRCGSMCTNKGRYCHKAEHGVEGKHILVEIVRRSCIWRHAGGYSKDDFGASQWLEYIIYFDEHCATSNDTFVDKGCIKDAFHAANIKNAEEIDICVNDDSGGLTDDNENSMLNSELASMKNNGIIMTPTIKVQDEILRWPQPTAESMFKTICSMYSEEAIPAVCTSCIHSPDALRCAQDVGRHTHNRHHHTEGGGKKKKRRHHGWLSFFFIALVGGGAFYIYKRQQETEDGGHWTLQEALMGDGTI